MSWLCILYLFIFSNCAPLSDLVEHIHFCRFLRNDRAIYRDERLAASRGKRMDNLCDQPLPCPSLTFDQNRDIRGSNLFDNPVYPIEFSPQNIRRNVHILHPDNLCRKRETPESLPQRGKELGWLNNDLSTKVNNPR